jgi:hypothetical protein
MTPAETAVELARAEIESQTFALTRQFLAVHAVMRDAEGRPAVARVDGTSEAGAHHVYFQLRNRVAKDEDEESLAEPYHCVVVTRPAGDQQEVSWVYIQPATRVCLSIFSDNLDPDAITARLGLRPTRTQLKGTPVGHEPAGRLRARHHWECEALPGLPARFEERLGTLIVMIEPAAQAIAALRPACEVWLRVVLEGWGGDPQFAGLGFDEASIKVLAAARAEIDFDVYAFGPPMAEDDDALMR